MRKGLWSPDEDEKLVRCITKYVNGSWSDIARKAGVDRCGKSCRRRWMNHLRPDLKRGKFSNDEINLIVQLQDALGNRWSDIASHLEGRTDNDVKNLWNTQIKKRLCLMKAAGQNTNNNSSNNNYTVPTKVIASDINYSMADASFSTSTMNDDVFIYNVDALQAMVDGDKILSFGNIRRSGLCVVDQYSCGSAASSCEGSTELSLADQASSSWKPSNSNTMPAQCNNAMLAAAAELKPDMNDSSNYVLHTVEPLKREEVSFNSDMNDSSNYVLNTFEPIKLEEVSFHPSSYNITTAGVQCRRNSTCPSNLAADQFIHLQSETLPPSPLDIDSVNHSLIAAAALITGPDMTGNSTTYTNPRPHDSLYASPACFNDECVQFCGSEKPPQPVITSHKSNSAAIKQQLIGKTQLTRTEVDLSQSPPALWRQCIQQSENLQNNNISRVAPSDVVEPNMGHGSQAILPNMGHGSHAILPCKRSAGLSHWGGAFDMDHQQYQGIGIIHQQQQVLEHGPLPDWCKQLLMQGDDLLL